MEGVGADPASLIPNGGSDSGMDQALYLPLFYGDARAVIHPGAATEVPTIQNGGVNANATTWTFHLRPHLVWSDRQPYDARDVDYTWKLWANPKFAADFTLGLNLISSADVSSDHLSITFHLKRPFASRNEAQVHATTTGGKHPVTGKRFRIRIVLVHRKLEAPAAALSVRSSCVCSAG